MEFLSPPLENPVPQCDLNNGWRLHGSDCYKVKADTRKTWSEARHDCVMEGGDLVSILSMAEEMYVTGSLDQTYFDMWIGLSTLVGETEEARSNAASNPAALLPINGSLISSPSSLLRNATRFRVRSNKETPSSAGLMQWSWATQTGATTKQWCKWSQGVHLFNLMSA